MRYKLLGKSGLRVSELALGTMTFGEDWGWGASKEECQAMFDLFAEAGGNFIDTSVNYTNGTSEKIVGDLIHADRDHFVVATKYSLSRNWDDPNAGGNSRKNMMSSLETSLHSLKTDYVDLYYLHMWDFLTPVEEVMRGLDDAVRAGKVRYVGVSDTPAYVVARANMLAELRGWSPFVAVQIPYSLLDRSVEREILPMAKDLGLAVAPWGILEAGLLTGKYSGDSKEARRLGDEPEITERMSTIIQGVAELAQQAGRSAAQVAVNWVRQQQNKAQMIPILGVRRAAHLKDNLAALEWQLDPEQIQRLDEASQIEMGFPHGFLRGNRYIYGNTYDLIDKE